MYDIENGFVSQPKALAIRVNPLALRFIRMSMEFIVSQPAPKKLPVEEN